VRAANPNDSFEALFGAEAKKVQGTADKRDDVAFAKKLMAAAGSVSDDKAFQALVYEKAFDFAVVDASGFETAQQAMVELAAAQPERGDACDERLLTLFEKQFRMAGGSARKGAAGVLVEKICEVSERKAGAGGFEEAIALLRRGLVAAVAVGPEKRPELISRISVLEDRLAARNRIAELTGKLRAKPDDAKVAGELVTALLVDNDDPVGAAKYAAVADGTLRHISELAVKDVAELTEGEAVQLGDWYKLHAHGFGKSATLARARGCYERFMSLHAKEDVQRLKVRLALDEIGATVVVKPSKPAPAAVAVEKNSRVVKLIPLVDLERDPLAGTWRRDKDELVMEAGMRYSPIRFAYQPPEEFDLRVEFTRVEGKGSVGLLWSTAEGRPAYWNAVDSKSADEGRHTALLRVRKGEISTFLDGKAVAHGTPDAPEWVGEANTSVGAGSLGVAAHVGPTRFHVIEVVEVSGKGRSGAHGDADLKDWRVLLWDAQGGRWVDGPLEKITVTVKDGVLEARNTAAGKAKALVYFVRQPMEANFSANFVWSGGGEISLRPTDGADDAIAYSVPDDKWHSARWRRTDGQIGLFVDEQQAPLNARNNPDGGTAKFFCFELEANQTLRVRHFALTVPVK